MTWQAPGAPTADPFAAIETDVRAMTASPWWMSAVPPQRAQAITSRMLAGAGEWWLFGVWGRWYRCGLEGNWHLCPPPFDPAVRQSMMPAPPGAGSPPVPPSIMPAGPDLTPGALAGDGLFGAPPPPQLLARLQQVLATAGNVNPAQFPIHDPQFVPGTPSPIAVCLFSVLWCAGAPVADADHPILGLFSRYLSGADGGPRWFLQPDLSLIAGAYAERLRNNDPMGAAHVARTVWETAETLRGGAVFQPRADALSAMSGATLQMVQRDHGGIRFGDAAVIQEWLRRCPPQLRVALLREAAPGDHFRLACYDLAAAAAALPSAASGPAEARRVALALLAADLEGAPGAASTAMAWLDPEAVRTLQSFSQPGHPLRRLWPVGGALPDAVAGADPQILRTLLAASYSTDLSWCRLAGLAPPRPGFTVPSALMNSLVAAPDPVAGESMSPWEIIEAARAHLAEQRKADAEEAPPAQGATTAWPGASPPPQASAPSQPGTTAWPETSPPPEAMPGTTSWPGTQPVPPTAVTPDPVASNPVEAHGIRFLPGDDDVERLLTELRRRGKWVQSLRGQEVSSASAPAVLLVGDISCGQRRLTRMIARALAEGGVSSGDVHTLDADDLAETDPRQLRERFAEYAGHTLLIEGLDALLLDDDRGAAYAAALYRARVEGVSDTTITATCAPERLSALSEVGPELVTDFRIIRLPDLSDADTRVELAALLAAERHLQPTREAWAVVRRDLGRLRGRGRLTNARLVEAYLDRACSRHLSQAGETQVFRGEGAMPLEPGDFEGVAAELEG
ncbi:hypothetical protein [Actinomadura sp. DC4]|uniref:hypothetical protein n=1 Tax=Actinomadura sp. DC4 TaxID=3055069 RepID=UPI0025B044D0|nr:hypothetical protein [Actinomadura sp. DC4]MDN3356187.1 hypothetical protein [Actinomadura sp. DC4]